jgi:DNA-binding LytR/AlgR family response regulator
MMKPFFVRHNRVYKRINPEEVSCLVTEENYTSFWMSNGERYLVRCTLSNALKKLPPKMFIKISRSMAVSIYYIDDIRNDYLLVGGNTAAIAKANYNSFIKSLDIIG